MPELTCPTCGQPMQGDVCVHCLLAAVVKPEHAEQAKVTPTASSDGAIREGEPPPKYGSAPNPWAEHDDDVKKPLTLAGCFLVVFCVLVIFVVAVPLVTWRDPQSGAPLPRMIAIAVPFLAAAVCFGIGSAILRFLGVAVSAKSNTGQAKPTPTNEAESD